MEELIKRLERVIATGAPDKDGMHPISAETVLEVVKELSELSTNLASLGTDLISRAEAIDALRKMQTYKLFSGDDMLLIDQAGAMTELMLLPSAQPEIIRCKDCKNWDTTWTNDFSPNYHYCPMVDGVRKEDWFCADAERRTDE